MLAPQPVHRMSSYDNPVSVQDGNISLCASRGSLVPSRRFQRHGACASPLTVSSISTDHFDDGSSSSQETSLLGKVVIAVDGKGGRHGIGETVAGALVQRGAVVHCLGLQQSEQAVDSQQVQQGQQQQNPNMAEGGTLHHHHVDISDTHALQQTIAQIATTSNRLDGLVAAGSVSDNETTIETTDIENISTTTSTMLVTAQEVSKQMIRLKTPGSIVLVAEDTATRPSTTTFSGSNTTTTASSRTEVDQLTKRLAQEWAKHGIRVNSLRPGTLLQRGRQHTKDESTLPSSSSSLDGEQQDREGQGQKQVGESNGISTPTTNNRIVPAEYFRGPAAFLLSGASAYMTGASLVIDGGVQQQEQQSQGET